MKNRKTILSILALLFLMGPFISTCYFIIKKQDLKISFFKRFENRKIQTIEINTNEIIWESKDKEIILNNNLFDVKTITYNNNKAIITGWFDTDEDDINVALDNHQKNSKKEKNTIPFFTYIFCEKINSFKIQNFLFEQEKNYYTKDNSPHTVALQIIAPPPRA